MKKLYELKWPRVSVEKTSSGFYRWEVMPRVAGKQPCLNFGFEFSLETAEQLAWNYSQLLLGEGPPLHTAHEIEAMWSTMAPAEFFSSLGVSHA